MDLEQLFVERRIALENKDFGKLAKCAIIIAEKCDDPLSHRRLEAQEAAFFLGRLNDRDKFIEIVYRPNYKLISSLQDIRSYDKEEKMFDMGCRYPFLTDEELDFLEIMYCSSNTYDMINRMLFDGDEMLRRKLSRFNADLFSVSNKSFSKKLCDDIFDAFIKNEIKYDVQKALDERLQPLEYKQKEASYCGYVPQLEYPPILVYNRLSNTVQLDQTDLSDLFLVPICNFSYAEIYISDAINLYKEYFGESVSEVITLVLEQEMIFPQSVEYFELYATWILSMEDAIRKIYDLNNDDYRLMKVRETIARKWLVYQNEKPLR